VYSVDASWNASVVERSLWAATFDHPLLKLAGIDAVVTAWREREPRVEGPEFLFLDEVQFIRDWGTWIKHQVDFRKDRRIAFTGSAMPLVEADQESDVGRWHTIRLTTLSFHEYLQIKRLSLPELPKLRSLRELFEWPPSEFYRASEAASAYVGHFHEYLLRGGFPQTAQIESILELCENKRISRGYVVTKALDDFGRIAGRARSEPENNQSSGQIMRIPAPLLCYWMGATEVEGCP
jgi:predicted AAA+ superfamily ATPase